MPALRFRGRFLAQNSAEHITPSMARKLPPPKKIKLANGKTRTLYFGFDGKFISKAVYEKLLGKTGQPPKPRQRPQRQKVQRNPALESLTRLLNQLEKDELPLVNELLQRYLNGTLPQRPANPAQESLARLLAKIEQEELPLVNNLIQHLIHTTALETKPIDLVALSDVDRVSHLNKLDSLTARAEIERYLQDARPAQQPPRLPSLHLQYGDLSRLDLHGIDLHDADLYRCDFTHTNLSEANLRSANLTSAPCDEANLAQADLTGAKISGAILTYAL
jgi:hypothetical protein